MACAAKDRLDSTAGSVVCSFEELITPIAEDFMRSGMTEDGLGASVEQERQAIWDAR